MIDADLMAKWGEAAAAFNDPRDLLLLAKCRMQAWAIRGELPGHQELAVLRRGFVPGARAKSVSWCLEIVAGELPCPCFAESGGLCVYHATRHAKLGGESAAARLKWCQGRREGERKRPPAPCKRCGHVWDRSVSRNCQPCARARDAMWRERRRQAKGPKLCRVCREPHPVLNEANCPKCTSDKTRWNRQNKAARLADAAERRKKKKAARMNERRLEYAADD